MFLLVAFVVVGVGVLVGLVAAPGTAKLLESCLIGVWLPSGTRAFPFGSVQVQATLAHTICVS